MLRHEHAASMRLQLEETLGTFNGYFFVTLYLNAAVQRITFGYVTRTSTFNDVRFRLHILQPYSQPGNKVSNYFNFHTFVMPRRLCYSRNCQCPLQHTELIEYSKILTIAVAETNAGNKVHTVGIVDQNAVFQFKGSYEDPELSRYKSIRVKSRPASRLTFFLIIGDPGNFSKFFASMLFFAHSCASERA